MKDFLDAAIAGCLMALVIFGPDLLIPTETYVRAEAYHTVKCGQTLWEIAGNRMDDQDRYTDIRDFIDSIREANNMQNASVDVGDQLIIPLYVKENK